MESTAGFLGMDTGMQYASEIFESHYENQNDMLWMDNIPEIAGQLDWDDIDPEMMGESKPATETNYLQDASKNLHSERKRRKN